MIYPSSLRILSQIYYCTVYARQMRFWGEKMHKHAFSAVASLRTPLRNLEMLPGL